MSRRMSYRLTPYQGFGNPDDPARFCHFHVRAYQGTYPDWESELLTSTRQIAGSSNVVTQVMGQGPARMTLELRFDCKDDYQQFRRYYGQVGTLSLLARYTSHQGPIRTYLETDYEQYQHTMLERISEVVHRLSGQVHCRATFLRASPEVPTW